jgi:hypothetical protein
VFPHGDADWRPYTWPVLTVATLALSRAFDRVFSDAPLPDDTPTWFAAWMTAAAALATAGTAILIWRQVVAGNKAVDVANRALKATQRQHAQSLYTTTETIKARIDANMPKITVTLPRGVRWPPENQSPAVSTTLERVSFTEEFKTNEHMSLRFIVSVLVKVHNEGEKTTEVAFNGSFYHFATALGGDLVPNLQAPVQTFTLKPNEDVMGFFVTDWQMHQWVKILEQRERRETQDVNWLDIMYGDSLDTGAHDTQRIILSGTILLRVHDSRERFVIPPSATVTASVQPTTRKYWLSRQAAQPLPEYSWDSITPLEDSDGSHGHKG